MARVKAGQSRRAMRLKGSPSYHSVHHDRKLSGRTFGGVLQLFANSLAVNGGGGEKKAACVVNSAAPRSAVEWHRPPGRLTRSGGCTGRREAARATRTLHENGDVTMAASRVLTAASGSKTVGNISSVVGDIGDQRWGEAVGMNMVGGGGRVEHEHEQTPKRALQSALWRIMRINLPPSNLDP